MLHVSLVIDVASQEISSSQWAYSGKASNEKEHLRPPHMASFSKILISWKNSARENKYISNNDHIIH